MVAFAEFRLTQEAGAATLNAGYCGSDGTRCAHGGANEGGPLLTLASGVYTERSMDPTSVSGTPVAGDVFTAPGGKTGMVVLWSSPHLLYILTGGANFANGDALTATSPATWTATAATPAATKNIFDTSGSPWAGCAAGDWLVWDTASAKDIRHIDSISGGRCFLDRAPTMGDNKAVNVNGAWPTWAAATTYVNALSAALWPAGVAAPRLNAITGVTWTVTAVITFSSVWSSAIPLTIQAFTTAYGDIDWSTTTTRATISSNQASGFVTSGNFIYLLALSIDTSTYGRTWNDSGGTNRACGCVFSCNAASVACVGMGPYTTMVRCAVTNGNTSTSNTYGVNIGTCERLIECTVKGGYYAVFIGGYYNDVTSCILYGFGAGGGVGVAAHLGVRVTGNTIADGSGPGVAVSVTTPFAVEIRGNLIAHVTGHGIDYTGGSGPMNFGQGGNAFWAVNNGAGAPSATDAVNTTIFDTSVGNLLLTAEPFAYTGDRTVACRYNLALASAAIGGGQGVLPQGTTYSGHPTIGAWAAYPDDGVYPAIATVLSLAAGGAVYGPNANDYTGTASGGGGTGGISKSRILGGVG